MRFFRVQIGEEGEESYAAGEGGEPSSLFVVGRDSWRKFLRTAGKDVLFSGELICGVCGSFTVPSLVFLRAIERLGEEDDSFDPHKELPRLLTEIR